MQTEQVFLNRDELQQAIQDLGALRSRLYAEAKALEDRIKSLSNRIEILTLRLSAPAVVKGDKPRLHKGEGIASILQALNGPDGLGMSQVQISEKTGISPSTVSRILAKNTDKVAEGVDHLFRRKMP